MNRFSKDVFCSDVYIGDYTRYRQLHSGADTPEGVVMSASPLEYIDSFHLINERHIEVAAINFEKNLAHFRDDNGNLVPQCECLCVSNHFKKKGWLVLIELKYCQESNIEGNVNAALAQLEKTHLYLRDIKGVLKDEKYRYYWVISMPEHSDRVPFSSFMLGLDKLAELRDNYGVNLVPDNELSILNEGFCKI